MAEQTNSTRTAPARFQNAGQIAKPQTARRGYVISEDCDLALKDLAIALDAVGELIESGKEMPELPEGHWGSLFRVFSRQAQAIHDEAGFADSAIIRPRDLH